MKDDTRENEEGSRSEEDFANHRWGPLEFGEYDHVFLKVTPRLRLE